MCVIATVVAAHALKISSENVQYGDRASRSLSFVV